MPQIQIYLNNTFSNKASKIQLGIILEFWKHLQFTFGRKGNGSAPRSQFRDNDNVTRAIFPLFLQVPRIDSRTNYSKYTKSIPSSCHQSV